MKDLLLKNGTVYVNQQFIRADIVVSNQKIEAIETKQTIVENEFLTIIDAKGLYVVPGFIDSHVHFNDPGREEWEGFISGSKAACAGGITTVFDMPLNSNPSAINSSILNWKKKHIKSRSLIDFGLWGGITADNVSDADELLKMKDLGIVGFKAFLSESGIADFKRLDRKQLKKAMNAVSQLGSLVALHAEDQELIEHYTIQFIKENRKDRQAFLESRPEKAEFTAIHHALKTAKETKAKVHFVHVSCPEAIELIHLYKQQGVDVSVEVCPHYLLFSDQDFIEHGPILKCAPPLRSKETIEKLWDCIAKGIVDTIGSDHSPCPPSMKEKGENDVWEAWGGIQGVQFGFQFVISEALRRGIALETILPLITTNVASRFQLTDRMGTIEVGKEGNFTIMDLNKTHKITEDSILFRHRYSPYCALQVKGTITHTIVRGQIVYNNGQFVLSKAVGKDIAENIATSME